MISVHSFTQNPLLCTRALPVATRVHQWFEIIRLQSFLKGAGRFLSRSTSSPLYQQQQDRKRVERCRVLGTGYESILLLAVCIFFPLLLASRNKERSYNSRIQAVLTLNQLWLWILVRVILNAFLALPCLLFIHAAYGETSVIIRGCWAVITSN
jgi:hypothetical protein